MYASFAGYDDAMYPGGFGDSGTVSAVPLEDYDYRDYTR